MPLDLSHIAPDIEKLSATVTSAKYQQRIELAQRLLFSINPNQLREKLAQRKAGKERIPWLVADPISTLGNATAAPPLPADFVVASADGSNVAPDRHSPAQFYVINTGRVVLGYGARPFATLTTQAALYYEEADLYFVASDATTQQTIPIEGALLGAKMATAELRALWEMASAQTKPVVALSDGTLILWTIQGQPKEARDKFVWDYVRLLREFQRAGIPIASYISKPASHDVVNSLRSFVCEGNPIHCGHCECAPLHQQQSADLIPVYDYQAFDFLEAGERSDIFESSSQILEGYGKEQRIQFFYLNVGGEIARIEAPQWVMGDETLLNLVHAVVYDQCQRSGAYPPYPPVLQEAHEQAVINTSDRRLIEQLVEEALQRQGIVYVRGAKDRSKRVRTI
jgi:hypothetical protein